MAEELRDKAVLSSGSLCKNIFSLSLGKFYSVPESFFLLFPLPVQCFLLLFHPKIKPLCIFW